MTGENLLSNSTCEEGKFWRSPLGKNGSGAEIVMDLTCQIRLERIHIRNGFGDFGTKSFSLWGSRSSNGPWRQLKDGQMPKLDDQVKMATLLHRILNLISLRDVLIV